MDLGLQGRRAVVTGGSKGIGKAIAYELALEGVDVAICARGNTELQVTASMLREKTEISCPGCGKAIVIRFDELAGRKREAQCRRCGTKYIFETSAQRKLKYAIKEFEDSQKEFARWRGEVLQTADILFKRNYKRI